MGTKNSNMIDLSTVTEINDTLKTVIENHLNRGKNC